MHREQRAACTQARVRTLALAQGTAPRWLKIAGGLWLAGMIVVALAASPLTVAQIQVSLGIVMFTVCMIFTFLVAASSNGGDASLPDTIVPWGLLPSYTILVPLYREVDVLPQLIKNLKRLSYPTDRLQIILILEEDDFDTVNHVASLASDPRPGLPEHITYVVVPRQLPYESRPGRGKPRAMNYVARDLGLVRGEFLVIYDAEDRPAPDQLLAAAGRFAALPESVAVLQAELRFENFDENLATRGIAASYAHTNITWMRGLAALGALMPLGGTSNHFRVSALTTVGFWNSHMVAEDAELAVRLFMAGYRFKTFPSVTYESAPTGLVAQINQRSRWLKGKGTAALLHVRNPFALASALGVRGSVSFFVAIVAPIPSALLAPFYWLMTVTYVATQASFIEAITPGLAFNLGLFCLAANPIFLLIVVHAVRSTNQRKLTAHVLAWLLLYWLVIPFFAAFIALCEIVTGQSATWRKTAHRPLARDVRGRVITAQTARSAPSDFGLHPDAYGTAAGD